MAKYIWRILFFDIASQLFCMTIQSASIQKYWYSTAFDVNHNDKNLNTSTTFGIRKFVQRKLLCLYSMQTVYSYLKNDWELFKFF